MTFDQYKSTGSSIICTLADFNNLHIENYFNKSHYFNKRDKERGRFLVAATNA